MRPARQRHIFLSIASRGTRRRMITTVVVTALLVAMAVAILIAASGSA